MTELPESTYHYHIAKKTKPHKDKELEDLIEAIFEEHKERYGYRRITIELRARGYKVNHKRVLRIEKQRVLDRVKNKEEWDKLEYDMIKLSRTIKEPKNVRRIK